MLILTRRVGETLMVIQPDGTMAEVTVLGVKGNQVRIGVNAPKEVAVHREEIYQRIQTENEQRREAIANAKAQSAPQKTHTPPPQSQPIRRPQPFPRLRAIQ